MPCSCLEFEQVEDLRSMGRMLKELCSKQQEEMKRLKGAFPTSKVDSPRLHELLEKQGRELKQARQVIPNLQEQVTSLTTQLKCLAEGLAEVGYFVAAYYFLYGSILFLSGNCTLEMCVMVVHFLINFSDCHLIYFGPSFIFLVVLMIIII